MGPERFAGSFRDPMGHVYHMDGRVFRTIHAGALEHYRHFEDSGCGAALRERGWLIEAEPSNRLDGLVDAPLVIEHPLLRVLSYPYEWPFALLREAALFHLDIQLLALDFNVELSDASAYNIQFRRGRPIFIDLLSFRKYEEGRYWTGHRQFTEQFLNPLLLASRYGLTYQPLYRGTLEGIPAEVLAQLSGWRDWLSPRILAYVLLPITLARRSRNATDHSAKLRPLPKGALRKMLVSLRKWVATLTTERSGKTTWDDYEETNTYDAAERDLKREAVRSFVASVQPSLMLDLGCNTGEYTQEALAAGAVEVVGFDVDTGALARAVRRRDARQLPFLPLYMDAANPSPDQGWLQRERSGFGDRFRGDAVIALAFLHHLAIGRNIPIHEAIGWVVSLADTGLIEFVPKSDPTVQRMLAFREDIFTHYCRQAFEQSLSKYARIVSVQQISSKGRLLYQFERKVRSDGG